MSILFFCQPLALTYTFYVIYFKRSYHSKRSNEFTLNLLGDIELQRKVKKQFPSPLEENVYYTNIEEIQKRKVRVSDLTAFLADKNVAYYKDEFDVSFVHI